MGVNEGRVTVGPKEFAGSKEECALDVDDRDRGDRSSPLIVQLAEFTFVGDFVFHEMRFGDFSQEEENGERHAEEDRDIKRSDESRDEGNHEDDRIIGSGEETDCVRRAC